VERGAFVVGLAPGGTWARFFFSSRRRHTRWPRDWSSDVCSSDLSSPVESAPGIGKPLAHFQPGNFVCVPVKITGGGRIDYPPEQAEKNPPASHEYETFGAHVMGSGQQDANGVCLADKGALEWVDHRPEMEVNGHPLNLHATEVTFAEVATDASCTDGAVHWGGKLRVQNTVQSDLDFEVWDCDNGEPGRNDGFAISVPAIDYAVQCFTVTPAD